jgi:glucokinase
MIGVELQRSSVVAVAVEAEGAVRRASTPAGGDLESAARAALDALGVPGGSVIGVAAVAPEQDPVRDALAGLARSYAGSSLRDGAVPSGTAAAVAEVAGGAARGARHAVFFAAGEQTTAGIIVDGAPLAGAHRRAASAAWLALNPVEREDYRRAGCLDAEVAAAGIVRRLVWRIKAGDRSAIQDAVGDDLSAITVAHVLDAARAHDGVAISVVRDTAKYLGMAAANLVVVVDPEVLVLGGIMASAADLLFEPVRTEIARRISPSAMQALTLVASALGDDAPALGAARLAGVAVP